MRYKKNQIGGMENLIHSSELTNISSISGGVDARRPGRPKGTTDKLKLENKQLKIDLANEISEEYNKLMMDAVNSNEKLKGEHCVG